MIKVEYKDFIIECNRNRDKSKICRDCKYLKFCVWVNTNNHNDGAGNRISKNKFNKLKLMYDIEVKND